MRRKSNRFFIGTSGWAYKHWNGPFYTKPYFQSQLEFYIQKFQTVEINNSFYHLPEINTFKSWHDRSPENFIFSIKASRFITHVKRLKIHRQSLNKFLKRAAHLKKKLGPILFQLPPHWNIHLERLEHFLKILPPYYLYTFEFRNKSWFRDETYQLLGKYKAAFCITQIAGFTSPIITTADWVYIRLHGPSRLPYKGSYSSKILGQWAKNIKKWTQQNKDVYLYFDNDERGFAPRNALSLKKNLQAH